MGEEKNEKIAGSRVKESLNAAEIAKIFDRVVSLGGVAG